MYPNNRKSNMKKWIVLTACCLAATLATAQEKKAYAIFDAEGRKTDYGEMLRALGERDVVFIGEVHNCPVAHWMELEIVKDLYALHDRSKYGTPSRQSSTNVRKSALSMSSS